MSFQGIRKIRDAKRESPILFSNDIFEGPSSQILPLPIHLKLKSNENREKKSTRDSQNKVDSLLKQTRKSSFGMSNSKEKQRRTMFGNFLHINLDGLHKISVSKQLRLAPHEGPRTERLSIMKSNTEDYQREQADKKISLNSFKMDFCVGKGGFGKVWKVYQKNSNKVYAMKEMQKVKIISKRSVHSVMNEKKLLQKLNYPFLVNIVHAFQTRQQLFLIMDYCNRGDMRYHIGNRRKFKEDQSCFFIACIVLCLQYLHKNKIMHRDLKPQNLVLDERGYVKLTDLGVSRQVKPNNAEDTSGTPGYMAPQVICKMNHSYTVDFFALGVIAYEFMIGKRPYVGQNRKQIRQKILAKQVQLDQIPPFGWSRESVDFINRLIQRKPQNRLGFNGIQEVKEHPWFKKIDWEKLENKKLQAPFLPPSIEEDYNNYKQCISEDTEIQNVQEYKLVLRHKDTQQAFLGYEYNVISPRTKRKLQRKDIQSFTHTTMSIRRRKSNQYQ